MRLICLIVLLMVSNGSCSDSCQLQMQQCLKKEEIQQSCECGQQRLQSLGKLALINGKTAMKGEFPWAAFLDLRTTSNTRETSRCGGSLVNDRFVVTAAHCFTSSSSNFYYDNITITLGVVDINQDHSDRLKVKAKDNIRIIHDRYENRVLENEALLDYDIGLLELETPVNWAKYPTIRPICLPERSTTDLSAKGILTGWGATKTLTGYRYDKQHRCKLLIHDTDRDSTSDILKNVKNISLESAEDCQPNFQEIRRRRTAEGRCPSARLTDINMCGYGGGCEGDSGGGLVTQRSDGSYKLIGIMSYNLGGCETTSDGDPVPNILTYVPPLTDWIKANTASGKLCHRIAVTGCPSNWHKLDDKCFILQTEMYPWGMAEDLCFKKGGTLASVPNEETHNFLRNLGQSLERSIWVGGYWNGHDWHWRDGTPWQYQSWLPDEPNRLNHMCVQMFHERNDPRWDDETCNARNSFFCEIDLRCPSGWFAFADSCYQLFDEQLTWEAAKIACKKLDASLATAETREVEHVINSLISKSNSVGIWLGARRRCPAACNQWEWENSAPWSYTNWRAGEPNNEGLLNQEECLESQFGNLSPFERTFQWNDVSCSQKKNYICKMSL